MVHFSEIVHQIDIRQSVLTIELLVSRNNNQKRVQNINSDWIIKRIVIGNIRKGCKSFKNVFSKNMNWKVSKTIIIN